MICLAIRMVAVVSSRIAKVQGKTSDSGGFSSTFQADHYQLVGGLEHDFYVSNQLTSLEYV